MAVYKEEKTNTWRAVYRYTDWNGERKQTQKRGFKTKRGAQAWEREQLNKTSADLDMTFKSFVDLYTADIKTRLKESTWTTKDHIIRTKLLPYFGRLKMCNITAQQIITWQNEMLNHKDENGKPSYALRDESNKMLDEAMYLLVQELKLPPIEEIGVDDFVQDAPVETFLVKLSQLNNRVDASYHVPIVKAIVDYLNKNAAEVTTIGDCRISRNVILPGRFKRVYVDEGYGRIFIGGKQLGELDPTNKKYLSVTQHGERIEEQLELHENMTLITCSGTIGKVALVGKHWENWTANQHIIRVVPANNEIAGYLSVFLSSQYGYRLITRYTYGSVIDEIDATHVSQTPIPILKNAEIQDRINKLALQANQKRYEAYLLEQKALRTMDQKVLFAK